MPTTAPQRGGPGGKGRGVAQPIRGGAGGGKTVGGLHFGGKRHRFVPTLPATAVVPHLDRRKADGVAT